MLNKVGTYKAHLSIKIKTVAAFFAEGFMIRQKNVSA